MHKNTLADGSRHGDQNLGEPQVLRTPTAPTELTVYATCLGTSGSLL